MVRARKEVEDEDEDSRSVFWIEEGEQRDKGCSTDGHAFWGSGPCRDASEGEKGQTRTYALLSGHFPQSADEGNHPVALRRAEFSTLSFLSLSHPLRRFSLFRTLLRTRGLSRSLARSFSIPPVPRSIPLSLSSSPSSRLPASRSALLSFSVAFFSCFPLSRSLLILPASLSAHIRTQTCTRCTHYPLRVLGHSRLHGKD